MRIVWLRSSPSFAKGWLFFGAIRRAGKLSARVRGKRSALLRSFSMIWPPLNRVRFSVVVAEMFRRASRVKMSKLVTAKAKPIEVKVHEWLRQSPARGLGNAHWAVVIVDPTARAADREKRLVRDLFSTAQFPL